MASLSLQPISLAAAPSSAPATGSGGSRSLAQLRRPQSWYSTKGGPIPATAGSHAVSLFLVLRRKRHRDLGRPRRPQRRFRGPRAASLRGTADPMGPSSDAQLQRLLSPAFIASFLSFLLYPLFAQAVASQLDSVALGIIKGDVSQYMQNFFNFNSLLFSFFVSQTYASLYQQQESLYMALYSEIAEARSLLEQLTLVSQNRPSYRSMLQSMDAYVEELILGVRVGCPPAVLVSAKPALDPLEAILYATSVGVPSVVYDTVRSLREARGQRLGATQRKLPWEHFVLLNVLGAMELLVFPLLGAGISGYEALDAAAPGHVLWIQSVVFAILAGGVVLALQVIQGLRSPTSGLYSLDSTLDEMVEGLRAELQHRLEAAPASSASRLPSPVVSRIDESRLAESEDWPSLQPRGQEESQNNRLLQCAAAGLASAALFLPSVLILENFFSAPALQAIREDNNAQWLQNCFTGVGLVFSLFAVLPLGARPGEQFQPTISLARYCKGFVRARIVQRGGAQSELLV
eukprot:s4456_g1.t2